jgi:small subunit ribosomal protein S21
MTVKIKATARNEGERLVKNFKRLCLRSGLFKELKRRRFYEKPSQRRRRRVKEARRAALKAERRKGRPAWEE